MFQISQQQIREAAARQVSVEVAHREAQIISFVDRLGVPFGWEQIALALAEGGDFWRLWNRTWAALPFDFEWKPVPIHPYTAKTHPFFAIAFPAQFPAANPDDFQRYLQALDPEELTATFDNFSGDAQLLVPKDTGDYGHIAAFCRTAAPEMAAALWQRVGVICAEAIAHATPVWCNTHGHGVPWLHIRFDSRLKYAAFPPRGSISPNSQAIWYRIYDEAIAPRGQVIGDDF